MMSSMMSALFPVAKGVVASNRADEDLPISPLTSYTTPSSFSFSGGWACVKHSVPSTARTEKTAPWNITWQRMLTSIGPTHPEGHHKLICGVVPEHRRGATSFTRHRTWGGRFTRHRSGGGVGGGCVFVARAMQSIRQYAGGCPVLSSSLDICG